MNIEGSVALVTGANRGLGQAFTKLLLERGAAKVYGGARNPATITVPGVVPVRLDVTMPVDIAAAAAECTDVTLLVNNAGISAGTSIVDDDALGRGRVEMETNAFGMLATSQAFAPVLATNGGGAIVNILSVLSWLSMPTTATYCASKAAAWSITNSLRVALQPQRTHVLAVHCAFLDTDMTARIEAPKLPPERVVELTLDALAVGEHEVLADDTTHLVRNALSGDLAALYPTLAAPASSLGS